MTAAIVLAALAAAAGCVAAFGLLEGVGGRTGLETLRLRRPPARDKAPGWHGLKLVFAFAGAICAAVVFSGSSARVLMLVSGVGFAAGYVAPDAWRARQTRRRIDFALRDLPDMLDLLCVALTAGAPPMRALAMVAAEFDGPLAREWQRVCAETVLGLPQGKAIDGIVERLPHDEMRHFAETLSRGRRRGTPPARAFAAQATRARHARAQRLRERTARAGPKIQLVVALVLVPSVLLMLAAALVAELERSGLALPAW